MKNTLELAFKRKCAMAEFTPHETHCPPPRLEFPPEPLRIDFLCAEGKLKELLQTRRYLRGVISPTDQDGGIVTRISSYCESKRKVGAVGTGRMLLVPPVFSEQYGHSDADSMLAFVEVHSPPPLKRPRLVLARRDQFPDDTGYADRGTGTGGSASDRRCHRRTSPKWRSELESELESDCESDASYDAEAAYRKVFQALSPKKPARTGPLGQENSNGNDNNPLFQQGPSPKKPRALGRPRRWHRCSRTAPTTPMQHQ